MVKLDEWVVFLQAAAAIAAAAARQSEALRGRRLSQSSEETYFRPVFNELCR